MKQRDERKKIQIIGTAVMALVLSALASLRNLSLDPETGRLILDVNWLKLAMIAVLSGVTMAIHSTRSRGKPHYIREQLLGLGGKKHLAYLDFARAAATISVIVAHALEANTNLPPVWRQAFAYIFLACNPLFLMVSGALLLEDRGESVLTFYWRRGLRVLAPMVLYFLVYQVLLTGSGALKPDNWPNLVSQLFLGSPDVPHYWLIYVILFLYLVTPLLRKCAGVADTGNPFILMGGMLIVTGLTAWLPVMGIVPWRGAVLVSWCLVFFTGYLIRVRQSPGFERAVLCLGILSGTVSLACIFRGSAFEGFLYNYAPTMVGFTAALLVLFRRRRKREAGFFVGIVSRYSFSILLIHWYVLYYVVPEKMRQLYVAPTAALTLLISFLFVFLFDNTVLLCADTMLQLPFRKKRG